MQRICKHCKQDHMKHRTMDYRCPLIDYDGKLVMLRYGPTFFEPKKTEIDKLVEYIESLDAKSFLIEITSVDKKKLLEELKALRNTGNAEK